MTLDIFYIVYLDNILIYSQNKDQHCEHVCMILWRLQKNMLYANLEKCTFFVTMVDFLGYAMSGTGTKMDPKRVTSIDTWPVPRNVKTLQYFLWFANFYRMSIPSYLPTIVPLLTLLKKKLTFYLDQ